MTLQHTLHDDELDLARAPALRAVPGGLRARLQRVRRLMVPSGLVAAGQVLDLLDPEGVTLARVPVTAVAPTTPETS